MNWKLIRIIDRFIGIPLVWLFHLLHLHRHGAPPPITRPQRILLIKFWGIGNIYMMLPAMQALRTTWQDATIDFLTLTTNHDAVKMTGTAAEVFTISTASLYRFIATTQSAIKALRHNHYDLIIDFEQFARFSALVMSLLRAHKTVGFATHGQYRHQLYTAPVVYDNDIHITRSFYQLAEKAGVLLPFPASVTMPHSAFGKNILQKLSIPSHDPVVIMHIGTSDNFMERRWPPSNYAALCELLIRKHGMKVILTGLADEKYLVQETISHLSIGVHVIDLSGKLTFQEYFDLIASADLVISADTAAVHIASAFDIPVAGLYGPNSPHLYGPWGNTGIALYAGFDCSPCITNFNSKINTCRHADGRGACMAALSVGQVYAALLNTYLDADAPCHLQKLESR